MVPFSIFIFMPLGDGIVCRFETFINRLGMKQTCDDDSVGTFLFFSVYRNGKLNGVTDVLKEFFFICELK